MVVSIAGCSLQITEATEPPKFTSLATVAHFLWLSTKPEILIIEGGLAETPVFQQEVPGGQLLLTWAASASRREATKKSRTEHTH